ncbi:MAG: RNA polymerase sigma factor SigJ [Alphaproteobacteria bacterium]
MTDPKTQIFLDHKGAIYGLAYRMLGGRADADDIVQEVALRWAKFDDWHTLKTPKSWLLTVASRLSIDQLRRAYRSRETYVGPWLPEPIDSEEPLVPSAAPSADDRLDRAETLSMAIMTLMDELGPEERVALLLHDVFDLDFRAVADALGKSDSAVRQMASRARKRLRAGTPRPHALDEQAKDLLSAFFEASQSGNREKLLQLMAPDITLISDGGGKARASLRPLYGVDDVLTVWASVAEKQQGHVAMTFANLNNQPAILIKDKTDGLMSAILLTVNDRAVTHIHIVRNPDKLKGLDG